METIHELGIGRLSGEIEANLKGVVETFVEKMRGAIRKEIRAMEEEFLEDLLSPKGKKRLGEQAPLVDEASKKISGAPGLPEEDDVQKPGRVEGPPIKIPPPRQEGVYIPDTDPTLRTVQVPEM